MTTVAPSQPMLTAEDYLTNTPEDSPFYQLIEGVICMAASPYRYHQDICLNIAVLLREHLATNPAGVVYIAPFDVFLDDFNVFQPDIAFFSNDRKHHLTKRGADGAPDFVVEILSGSTARLDRNEKREVYARHGVIELWIVDPDSKSIERHLLQENATAPVETISAAADTIIEPTVLPGLEFDLGRVFAS